MKPIPAAGRLSRQDLVFEGLMWADPTDKVRVRCCGGCHRCPAPNCRSLHTCHCTVLQWALGLVGCGVDMWGRLWLHVDSRRRVLWACVCTCVCACLCLCWSPGLQLRGVAFNAQRQCSVIFGADVTNEFLRLNGWELIIRSHECVMEGYQVCGGWRERGVGAGVAQGVRLACCRCGAAPATACSDAGR